jgi:hypothetical protein
MNSIHIIFILILVILNIFSFVLGCLVGKLLLVNGVSMISNKPKSFFQSEQKSEKVNIDEKIHITNIKTDGMVKKYDSLGEVKTSEENINNSIEKLKKMKG